ncbi:MAG: hypothetical protein HY010_10880 [Acidobacteria bacterium]|nr:hypothetical protein [Acidobacteriota bacterium]
MDLNLINVLPQSKASSPSPSTHVSANNAKQAFADVLSAQPHPKAPHDSAAENNASAQKLSEKKQDPKKDKGTKQATPDSERSEPATSVVPAILPAARVVANELLGLSFFPVATGTEPATSTGSQKSGDSEAKDSASELTKVPGTPDTVKSRVAISPQASTGTPSLVGAVAQDRSTGDASPSSLHRNALDGQDADASLQSESEVARGNETPKSDVSATDRTQAFAVLIGPSDSAAATRPDSHLANGAKTEVVSDSKSVAGKGDDVPTTNTSAAASASTEPTMSALVAAAEKVGAIVSTGQTNNSKPGARQISAATKTLVSQTKSETTKSSKPSGMGATVSVGPTIFPHSSSKQETTGATIASQDASSTIKPATADATPKDAVPSGATSAKDGAVSVAATPHSPNAQSRDGIASGPAATATPATPPHRDASSLSLGRENSLMGAEISGLSKTSLIEHFRQSEMRFGMQSGEFGRIEVRTLLDHHEVTARISVERGDLSRALESELPGLQKRLTDLDVPSAKITLHEQSSSMSMTGEQGRRPRAQDWQSNQPAPSLQLEPALASTDLIETSIATEGLSIRI